MDEKLDKIKAIRKLESMIEEVCGKSGHGEISFDIVDKRIKNLKQVIKEKTDLRVG